MIEAKANSLKPLIGISMHSEICEKDPFMGEEAICLNTNYIESIRRAGGIPILLPSIEDEEEIWEQMYYIDGLLLSGGYDIQPTLYGEEPHVDLGKICPFRDQYELKALLIAEAQKKPVLGICRGLQLMNVAFAGILYQDISHRSSNTYIQHFQKAQPFVPSHTVELKACTHLYKIFEQEKIMTNSFHHQAIKELAAGFTVNALTKDGVIEGIERENHPFFMGVQWHPEKMTAYCPYMLKLFQHFIEHAKDFKRQRR